MNRRSLGSNPSPASPCGPFAAGGLQQERKYRTVQHSAPASAPAAPAATPIDPATVGSISGTVKFDGTAPKPAKIDMRQDPACKGTNEAETIVADERDLANVFVYVKDGLGTRTFDVPKDPVVLDQRAAVIIRTCWA